MNVANIDQSAPPIVSGAAFLMLKMRAFTLSRNPSGLSCCVMRMALHKAAVLAGSCFPLKLAITSSRNSFQVTMASMLDPLINAYAAPEQLTRAV